MQKYFNWVYSSYHSWDGVQCIPKIGMLSVSREITPFWYEMQTFVLTVYSYVDSLHALPMGSIDTLETACLCYDTLSVYTEVSLLLNTLYGRLYQPNLLFSQVN